MCVYHIYTTSSGVINVQYTVHGLFHLQRKSDECKSVRGSSGVRWYGTASLESVQSAFGGTQSPTAKCRGHIGLGSRSTLEQNNVTNFTQHSGSKSAYYDGILPENAIEVPGNTFPMPEVPLFPSNTRSP